MAGAPGALVCTVAGLAAGMAVRELWAAREQLLCQTQDMLTKLRLLLQQERMGLCELLEECAAGLEGGMPERFRLAAQRLRCEPLSSLEAVYRQAEAAVRCSGEQRIEKAAMRRLFSELGSGTAAMRERAVASCLRRLAPAEEKAKKRQDTGGKLCVQLGLLAGAMVGIMLW